MQLDDYTVQTFLDQVIQDFLNDDAIKAKLSAFVAEKSPALLESLLKDSEFLRHIFYKAVSEPASSYVANEIGNRLRCGIYDNLAVKEVFEKEFPAQFRNQMRSEIQTEIRKVVKEEVQAFVKKMSD